MVRAKPVGHQLFRATWHSENYSHYWRWTLRKLAATPGLCHVIVRYIYMIGNPADKFLSTHSVRW